MAREKIIKALKKATRAKKIHLESPEIESHGDYATNIAMIKAKEEKRSPKAIAEDIVETLSKDKDLGQVVSKIEVAGPGFINFWLGEGYLLKELEQAASEKDYGESNKSKGKKVMFEYGQPNTHKLPHIGHLYSYVYGEAMTRIMEAVGWEVYRANYQGDIGPHVAKSLWSFQKQKPKVPETLGEKAALLQKLYQEGSKAYSEDKQAKEEIDKLNRAIYAKDSSVVDLWNKTRLWSISYYKEFEKLLGIKYDRYYYESQVQKEGREIVEANEGKVFKRSEGALIFEGSRHKLHDRVFVTSVGTPTYEAKDMYLQKLKMKEWPADLLIIATAHEQNEYFKVIFKALETLDPNFKGKLKHIGFGMVQLKTGKMSSRTGNIVGGIELVETVIERIKHLVKKSGNKDQKDVVAISQQVGLGAVKYSFLKNNPLQDTSFDIDESIAEQGNSGPYLQYTYARTQSILRKSKLKEPGIKPNKPNSEELLLLRALPKFSEVLMDAAKNYSPNLICNYLFDFAQKFNSFYNAHKIIRGDNEKFKIALTQASGQILTNGLNLLGIDSPKRM